MATKQYLVSEALLYPEDKNSESVLQEPLLKNLKILLFDDCLSAVDTETEEQILKNLNKLSSDRTTVIVSHRVSSAKMPIRSSFWKTEKFSSQERTNL
jgi:ABC-type bacteriocin/lantibiotic exporter with double-glycine peptidase domain